MMQLMKESVLQYSWQFRRYDPLSLFTTEGEQVQVIHPGTKNRDSGPDFLDAHIRIGAIEWRGNVEIHTKSSAWLQHGHQHDDKYKNVILHVVYEDDLHGANRPGMPVLELNGRIPLRMLRTVETWQNDTAELPCRNAVQTVSHITWTSWKDRMLAERLDEKYQYYRQLTAKYNGDRELACWHLLARYLFTPANRMAVDTLFETMNWRQIWKVRDSLFQLEAILLGQAGMLDEEPCTDQYKEMLRKEFAYQQHKLGLRSMPGIYWHFLRMRPTGFPTMRIAYLASVLHASHHLFETISSDPEGFLQRLGSMTPGEYWQNHYSFGGKSVKTHSIFGSQMVASLAANVVAVVLYANAFENNRKENQYDTLQYYTAYPSEQNYKLKIWRQAGIVPHHLGDSQALLHLMDNYCSRKKCLDCAIGHAILNRVPLTEYNTVREAETLFS